MSNGTFRVVDEYRGHWMSMGDTLFFAHDSGAYSAFDGWELTHTRFAPAPFPGSGAFVEAVRFADRFLWIFEDVLVRVDGDLSPLEVVKRPRGTMIIPSTDGRFLYSIDANGVWSALELPRD